MDEELKIGDSVMVNTNYKAGFITDIDVIMDDDGLDEDGRPIVRDVTFYKVEIWCTESSLKKIGGAKIK